MDSCQREATAQVFGLSLGYLVVSDVISWADSVILGSATPAREIVDVATAPNNRDELQRRLRVVAGSFEVNPDRSAVLKSMRDTFAKHPERAGPIARGLLHLFADDDGEAASEARHVDYAFELADDHVQGDQASATAELRDFLRKWS